MNLDFINKVIKQRKFQHCSFFGWDNHFCNGNCPMGIDVLKVEDVEYLIKYLSEVGE